MWLGHNSTLHSALQCHFLVKELLFSLCCGLVSVWKHSQLFPWALTLFLLLLSLFFFFLIPQAVLCHLLRRISLIRF